MDILIVCDPKDKYTLNLIVKTYHEALVGIRPDEIIVIKPEDEHPHDVDRIKKYIREQVKLKLQKDKEIIYL